MENVLREMPMEEKAMPKHIDFTNHVFNELKSAFDVEEQATILVNLHERLKDFYLTEMEHHQKNAANFKSKLEILSRVEPKAS